MAISVPDPQLALSEQPKTQIDSSAFNRPIQTTAVAQGLEQLGAGAGDLAVPLAKQQAQGDIRKAVTYDANGQPQVATPQNSIILGRAGQEYQDVAATGQIAAQQSAVTQQMADLHAANPLDVQAFNAASAARIQQIRNNPDLPAPVANALADHAQNLAAGHATNIVEKSAALQTKESEQAIKTTISDTQNEMEVLARQQGQDTPRYQQLHAQLEAGYSELASKPIFGYSQTTIDSMKATALSRLQASQIVGMVDATFTKSGGDGGKAGATRFINDQIYNNPALHLEPSDRNEFGRMALAHLDYLTNEQRGVIDASRQSTGKVVALAESGKPVPDDAFRAAIETARGVGDGESVLKLQAYQERTSKVQSAAGQTDEQRVLSMNGGDYMSNLHRQEGGASSSTNPVTGAAGPNQFLPSTWAGLIKNHPELNLTQDGIRDPAQNARAIATFTSDNRQSLRSAGIEPNDKNTYMAHFLGAGGATSFIKAMQANPGAPAAQFNLAAATANPTIFYRGGDTNQPRSLQEVYALQTAKFGGGTTPVVPAGVNGAPTHAEMAANPFALPAYLDSLKGDDKSDIKAAKNVADAVELQFKGGNTPPPATVAAVLQMARKYPDQLGEQAEKIQNYMGASGDSANALATMAPEQSKIYGDQVMRLSQGTDLNAMAKAEATKALLSKGAERLKTDQFGEMLNRNWITRPVTPIDFSSPQGIAALPQAMADRSSATSRLQAISGQSALPLAPDDLKQLAGGLAGSPAPAVAQTLQAISTMPPQQLDGLMANGEFKQTILGLTRSGDPAKMNAAFSFLDAQNRRNPLAFDADDSGALKSLRSWQALGQYLPADAIAKRMTTYNDPGQQNARKLLDTQADEALKTMDANAIVNQLYAAHVPGIGLTVPFTTPKGQAADGGSIAGSPIAAGDMAFLYKQSYKDLFAETGDAAASSKYAMEKVGNKYSVSTINNGRVMAYAPDRENADGTGAYYKKVDNSFDWLQDQLREDVKGTPWGKLHYGEDEGRASDLAQGGTLQGSKAGGGSEYMLMPDAKTQADISSGRPPSYTVLAQGNDGRLHVVEGSGGQAFRFRGDVAAAQAKATADFNKQHAARMAATAAPDGGNANALP